MSDKSIQTSTEEKKKRGRPRKYTPEENRLRIKH